MKLNLTREGYLEQRLAGKIRGTIAQEQGVSLTTLLTQLSKWGLRDLQEERDLLDRMRVARGIPQTESGQKRAPVAPTPETKAPAYESEVEPTAAVPAIDLKRVIWVTPVKRESVPLRFTSHGVRVAGWVAEKIGKAEFAEVGFSDRLMIIKPSSSSGWRVQRKLKVSGYLIGTKRVLDAATAAGFKTTDKVTIDWHPEGFLIIQPVG